MKTLVWSKTFIRAYKRATKRDQALKERIQIALHRLGGDSFHPLLRSHKLKGELVGIWACTVDYHNRILFEFVNNPDTGEEEIYLLTMGTHDEVY